MGKSNLRFQLTTAENPEKELARVLQSCNDASRCAEVDNASMQSPKVTQLTYSLQILCFRFQLARCELHRTLSRCNPSSTRCDL